MYSVDAEVSVNGKAVFYHIARFRVRHLDKRLVLLSEFLDLLYVQFCSCTRLCTCARLSFSDALIYFAYIHTVCFFIRIAIPTDSNNNLTSGLASGLYTSRASFPTGNHGTLSVFP
jgi:hypothetical protein